MKKHLLSLSLALPLVLVSSASFAEAVSFLWERDPLGNNCYNYAIGVPTGTFLQPGAASGRPVEVLTCENDFNKIGLIQAAENDGLRFVPSIDECKNDEQIVALFNVPGFDYHWFRLEDDGVWTHKMGNNLAINTDRAGKVITDLRKADLGQYKYFCGYFCIDYTQLKVNIDKIY